jgi:hypothetical protein
LKNKGLIITTIIFFLLVNTTYYWEGKLGILTFPAFLILVIVFVGLFITLLRQLYFATKEKFKDKQRSYKIALLTVVLTLTIFRPFGLVDFDKLNGADILIATREGGGNCTTTLKLKENYEFRQRDVCFGVTEVKGMYKISNDTIYFETSNFNRGKNEYYDFAVIRPTKYGMEDNKFDLVLFNKNDTIGHELYVIKNEISKRK